MAKRGRKPKPPQVFIFWWNGDVEEGIQDGLFNTLAYQSGAGEVRVYYKDLYDGRIDLGRNPQDGPIPYFDNAGDAAKYVYEHPGKKCQVNVRASSKLGWPKNTLAEVA